MMSDPAKNIRVLLVEDSENDALLTLRYLKRGGFAPESLRVESRAAFEEALRDRTWDVILCDYSMPGFNGADALRIAQEHGLDVPFIVISGTIGEELAVSLMKAGAADYLLKDSLGKLVPTVERELRDAHVRREQRSQHEILRESEAKFSTIFQQAPLLITLSDIETGTYIEVNEKFLKISGFTRGEVIGRTVLELGWNTPEQRSRMLQELQETGRVSGMELTLRSKQGKTITCLYNGERVSVGGRQLLLSIAQDITARKQAEAALAHSHDLMRYVIEHAKGAVAVHDKDLKYVYVSQRYLDEYQVKEKDVIGKHHYEVFPDLPQKWRDVHQRALAGEVLSAEDDPYPREDGTVDWTRWECRPWYEPDGSIGGIIVYTEVITERKKAEEALWQSRNMLNQILNTMPQSVFWKDRDCVYLGCNDVFAHAVGLDNPDRIVGKTDFDLPWPRSEAEAYQRDDREVIAGKRPKRHIVEPLQQADGSRLWIDTSKIPLADREGNVFGVLGVYEDITEQRKVEEKIRQSEQFIRGILDTVDEGFIVVDRDFLILTANKAYCIQVGMASDEVIGKQCFSISHRASRPCGEEGEECAVQRVFATGMPHAALHKHVDPEGHVFYVETKGFPIRDASGAVTSVIETVNNITEKHLLEEERLKTQKLESIGTLAGGIAHDFNNLLQGVFGYIAMAKICIGQRDRALEMLDQAERAVHQSVSLTSQLLTFSKGGKPVKQRVSLVPIIENATKFALSGSRSDYRMEIAPGLWSVDADSGQMGQVIQNIVLNADQAMAHGGSVVISARNMPASDQALPRGLERRAYVVIEVQDSGVGIPNHHLEKIFDPYFTTKEKGSGLGLATSYSIIRNHDGRIDVRSEAGKGATFTLYLPASQDAPAEAPVRPVAATGRRGRILVMDDEEIVRNVTGELIRALGHEAAFAVHGEDAVAKFLEAREAGAPFDIVILDLTIRGGMGGAETFRRLREIDPDVAAVVSSGYSGDAPMAKYQEHGFRAFLKKPYALPDLQSVLNTLLGQ